MGILRPATSLLVAQNELMQVRDKHPQIFPKFAAWHRRYFIRELAAQDKRFRSNSGAIGFMARQDFGSLLNLPIFCRTSSLILINGGHGLLKPSPASLRVASIPSFVPIAISEVA